MKGSEDSRRRLAQQQWNYDRIDEAWRRRLREQKIEDKHNAARDTGSQGEGTHG